MEVLAEDDQADYNSEAKDNYNFMYEEIRVFLQDEEENTREKTCKLLPSCKKSV